MNKNTNLKQINEKNNYINSSYLGIYDNLLKNKMITNIIQNGYDVTYDSTYVYNYIKLWNDYLPNALINTIINTTNPEYLSNFLIDSKNKIFNKNPYHSSFIESIKENRFDIILYNGNKNDTDLNILESMKLFIELYISLIIEDGILIIEDIKHITWLDILSNIVPEKFKKCIKTYDLREIKNRQEDIIFIIDTKLNKSNVNVSNIPPNIPEIVLLQNKNIYLEKEPETPMDICLVINTCKQNSSNMNELINQINLYNTVFPKENILIVSGQEDTNSISYLNGIKYIKVTYSSIHLTSAIYINENINDFKSINYWVLLPDTIKFGTKFFTKIFKYYNIMKNENSYSLPFVSPILRPTMDMGIVHTKHIINMTNYLKKIKVIYIDKTSLLTIKKQLIYDENTILGLRAEFVKDSTKFEYLFTNNPPTTFITNSNLDIKISTFNNIQCVYLNILDLYKYQKNFDGPYSELFIAL